MTIMKRTMRLTKDFVPLSKSVAPLGSARSAATLPRKVLMPVLTAMPRAEPEMTVLPWKHAFLRSKMPWAGSAPGAASFSTGRDSPVSAAWATKKSLAETMRMSAGTMEPAERARTSPGAISAIGTSTSLPSRRATELAWIIILSFSAASPERRSWK